MARRGFLAATDQSETDFIVPLEPTKAMIEAGSRAAEAHPQITILEKPALYYAWRAMVEAAQLR